MDENMDLDRRVLRQMLYTGMLNIGTSDLRDKINSEALHSLPRSAVDYSGRLASASGYRELLGNCFSSSDTCMYLDMVGLFGLLAPMYSSGDLDLKLFNDPELLTPLHEYVERSLSYLSGRQYVEIPDEATATVGTFIPSIAPTLYQGIQDLSYKQKNSIYYSDYYLRLTADDTTDIFVGDGTTPINKGMLLNVRVDGGALNFRINKKFLWGDLDKHFAYRRLREVMAIEAWLHMLETGECLDLREVKKDLATFILLNTGHRTERSLRLRAVPTGNKKRPTEYYRLELHYYR